MAYNRHPDVLAHDRGESGTGSIALDGRKRQGVRNWLDRCCQAAFNEVLQSTHDLAYNLGPFGEVFSYTNSCFLTSTIDSDGAAGGDQEGPLPGEGYVEVVWFSLGIDFDFFSYQDLLIEPALSFSNAGDVIIISFISHMLSLQSV